MKIFLLINIFHLNSLHPSFLFQSHSYFSDLQGVINYFKFMDVEGHVLGIFKQVINL